MKPVTVFLCSPRANGDSDALGLAFAEGLENSGHVPQIIPLRDYQIKACAGCGACANPPWRCVLNHPPDQAEELFDKLLASSLAIFATPIYFYAMPAHFKAFIDRGQRFWHKPAKNKTLKALAIMTAGSSEGKELFSATCRTLAYFLKCLGGKLIATSGWKGMDSAKSETMRTCLRDMERLGSQMGNELTNH